MAKSFVGSVVPKVSEERKPPFAIYDPEEPKKQTVIEKTYLSSNTSFVNKDLYGRQSPALVINV